MNDTTEDLQKKRLEGTKFISRGRLITPEEVLFAPRMFAQHPFPKSDLKESIYHSVNGSRVMIMASGNDYDISEEEIVPIGLPYGMIPRLLILNITTRVKRKGEPVIKLADHISDLLDLLDYEVSGGKTGSITQLNTQVKRLLECQITYKYIYSLENNKRQKQSIKVGPIDGFHFWEANYSEKNNRLTDIHIKVHDHFLEKS